MHQSACTPWRRGPVSFLYDIGIIPYCAQHHPSCLDIQAISQSFIITLVLEQLLNLSQRHLCRPENGCALSFPPPCLSRADLCPRRSFPWFYFWSFVRGGPMLFSAPSLLDTSPVISECPREPLPIPEQALSVYLQSFHKPSLNSCDSHTDGLASSGSVSSRFFSPASLEACGEQSLLFLPGQ